MSLRQTSQAQGKNVPEPERKLHENNKWTRHSEKTHAVPEVQSAPTHASLLCGFVSFPCMSIQIK